LAGRGISPSPRRTAVTAPDDERDRVRDLDDTSAVPEADRPAATTAEVDRPGGMGDIPTHRSASEPMPGTSEETPPVEGVYIPDDDRDT
jgi:hypothetical protein